MLLDVKLRQRANMSGTYRDLICLKDWLRTARGIDVQIPSIPFALASTEWRAAVEEVLSKIRHLNSAARRDRYQRILDPLPDAVNAAYANLFRASAGSFEQFVDMLRSDRRTRAGGTQRSAFPDGAGSAFVDDYGFPGYWESSVDDGADVSTVRALRTIDALSKSGATGGRVRFVTSHVDSPKWYPACDELRVPDSFTRLSRREQIDRFANSHEWRDMKPPRQRSVPAVPPPDMASRVALATLALTHTGRARDYTHFRFNYRVAVMAETLGDSGIDVRSRSIEDAESCAAFLADYRDDPVDVVVISVYQHKPDDMKLLADLIRVLRAIRSDVLIVLEGVATQPAKQMLALFPEVDMLVRGESESSIRALLSVKERDRPLTSAQCEAILRDGGVRRGGIFLRTMNGGIFSHLDCEQQDEQPRLLRPQRHMQAVWYSERGCPSSCGYCPLYTGHQSGARVVSAQKRIEWMLNRLRLEFTQPDQLSDEVLREWLASVSLSDSRFRLRDDTFIGRGKVTITTVSQNALVNRPVWMAFCREVREFRLDRYFRIKVADTSINTLWRNAGADRELIRALKDAGVFFIGFGTESLSERILNDLRKGHGHRQTSDYDADAPIEIAAALHEEGFPTEGVRHNFMSNAPESLLSDVKEGMVLAYVGPLFNHSIERLGNGWGNSRQNRLYAIEGSLHTAVDSLRYGNGDFFVCDDAPEYMVRMEEGRLTYIDERLQPMATEFTYPAFYRYAMKDVLRAHVSDDDIAAMRGRWKLGASEQLRALARIMSTYQQNDPELSNLDTLSRVKAHMISFECFRFTDWEARLRVRPGLVRDLELAGITTLIDEADSRMRPQRFDPGAALANQMLSAQRASAFAENGDVEDLRSREAAVRKRGLHTLLSYPDSQQFDNLCRACPLIPPAELFDQLIHEMRDSDVAVAAAVRNIVCRVLGLMDADYDDFVKMWKRYEAIPDPRSGPSDGVREPLRVRGEHATAWPVS